MNKREQRRPMIVESWEGGDPLDAFALERPSHPIPPALPPTASADFGDIEVEFIEPRITQRPARRPTAAILGVAGLVGVAAGTVAVLTMFVGGSQSTGNVATFANRSESGAPAQVGSAGQIAEREVIPEAINLSASAPEPTVPEPIQSPPAPRVERQTTRTVPPPAATRSVSQPPPPRPAPIVVPPPVTPVRQANVSAPPPSNGVTSAPLSAATPVPTSGIATSSTEGRAAPPIVAVTPTPNAATAAPASLVTPAPSSTVTAPPPNVVTASASNVAVAPANAVPPVTSGGATAQSAVTAVLQRYAKAFSALDARAAKAVWPQVNQDALARAFASLQEQQFDLGSCDISVTGASAVASCAGRATYTPKVGNRKQRSEAREWTFYLDQDDQRWSIATVKTR